MALILRQQGAALFILAFWSLLVQSRLVKIDMCISKSPSSYWQNSVVAEDPRTVLLAEPPGAPQVTKLDVLIAELLTSAGRSEDALPQVSAFWALHSFYLCR